MLLDTSSSRGISPKAFTIELDRYTGVTILTCQATNGVFFWRETKDAQPKHLQRGDQFFVRGNRTWIIVVGNVQIALIPIVRDNTTQSAYRRNFNAYKGGLVKDIPNVEKLRIEASEHNPPPRIPVPRDLTGIRGNYTTAGKVSNGGINNVSGLDTLYPVLYFLSRHFSGSANAELVDHGLYEQDWRQHVLHQGSQGRGVQGLLKKRNSIPTQNCTCTPCAAPLRHHKD